jgi:hypothetical protein
MRERRHPRGSVIAYIWIATFVAGLLLATFFQDDDPKTDDAAGAGALIFVVGGALTIAYLAVGRRLSSRNVAIGSAEAQSADGEKRTWVRRNVGPLAAGAAGLVVLVLASAVAPSPDTAPDSPERPNLRNKRDLVATIRAAAREASSERRITSVDCVKPVDVSETLLLSCAVTFEGPACQLWLAGALDDPEPLSLSDPADGRWGWADDRMAHCE